MMLSENIKRKLSVIIIAAAIGISLLSGCSKKNASSEELDYPMNDKESVSETNTYGITASKLKRTALVNEADIKIEAEEVTADADKQGVQIILSISNSTDKDLYFQTRNDAVNGCVINGLLSEIVKAGETASIPLTFDYDDIRAYGIKAIQKIEFNFYIFSSDTYEEYLVSDPICIDLKSDDDEFSFTSDGNVLYDGNGVKVVELTDCFYAEQALEYSSYVYVENNTDGEILVTADAGLSTAEENNDGTYTDLDLFAQVSAGKCKIAEASLREMFEYDEEAGDAESTNYKETGDAESKDADAAENNTQQKTVKASISIIGLEEPIFLDNIELTMKKTVLS